MTELLTAPVKDRDTPFLTQATVELFTTVVNTTQSSRALGWDTNDYASNQYANACAACGLSSLWAPPGTYFPCLLACLLACLLCAALVASQLPGLLWAEQPHVYPHWVHR